jgi:hypothetical protein
MEKRRLTRSGIYPRLDCMGGSVEDWLDEKRLLDAELVAEEGMAWHGAVESGTDCEDLEEWLERQVA